MTIKRLFSTTRVRISAIYTCLLVSAFVIAGIGAWLATRYAAQEDVRGRIASELAIVHDAYAQDGLQGISATIAYRTSYPTTFVYRLDAPGGGVLTGDGNIPNDVLGWRFFEIAAGPDVAVDGDHYIFTEMLANGARLSIADDMERPERIRDAVLHILIWVGVLAVIAGLLAGYVIARPIFRRMSQLSQTVRTVSAGNLEVRIPTRGKSRPDDLDDLISSFNGMLDHIDSLVENIRRVSMNVAHDLRTPLTHIRRRLEMILNSENPATQREAVEQAQGEIDTILRTSDAILGLASIASGAARASFIPIEMAALIERVCDAYRPDVEASGRELSIGHVVSGKIMGEPHLLVQMLGNLMENAMRHTLKGTHISVTFANGHSGSVLSVRDNGAGIPERERVRVVRPFERFDESRTTPGSGLGLSIVDAIARLHHAELQLKDGNPGLIASVEFSVSAG